MYNPKPFQTNYEDYNTFFTSEESESSGRDRSRTGSDNRAEMIAERFPGVGSRGSARNDVRGDE